MDAKKVEFHMKRSVRRINFAGGRVDTKRKRISPPKYPGIKTLGAVDCLVNYHKYSIVTE